MGYCTASGWNRWRDSVAAVPVRAGCVLDADPNGTLSQYSATIEWGDHGAPTAAAVVKNPFSKGFAAGGVHHYAGGGTYTITVTVNDLGGAIANRSTTLVVAS
jgi:hypothetical protein